MSRPRLLAVSGLAPWPPRGGFALRAAGLLDALVEHWEIDLIVGAAVDRIAGGDGMHDIVAVPEAQPWRTVPSLRADHRALREAVDRVIADRDPAAVLLFNGTEFLAFDRPGFPPVVADRIDCGALERHRYIRYARNLRGIQAAIEARLARRYERRVVRSCAATTVVGDDDEGALRRIAGSESVYVVMNGVEALEGTAFEAESPDPTVLFTGTLSYYANADAVRYFVRQIWPDIRSSVDGARFVAAGRSPGRSIRALASVPGVEIRPEVTDMSSVIRESWVSVAPMRCGSGVKNKVLEAWAAGRPAVLTPLGANGLQVDEHARELMAADPAAFGAIVTHLLRNTERRHEHGSRALTLAKTRHTWRQSAANMSDVLQRVLRHPGAVAHQSQSAS